MPWCCATVGWPELPVMWGGGGGRGGGGRGPGQSIRYTAMFFPPCYWVMTDRGKVIMENESVEICAESNDSFFWGEGGSRLQDCAFFPVVCGISGNFHYPTVHCHALVLATMMGYVNCIGKVCVGGGGVPGQSIRHTAVYCSPSLTGYDKGNQ